MEQLGVWTTYVVFGIGAAVCVAGGLWISVTIWLAATDKLTTLLKVKRAIIEFYIDRHHRKNRGAG